MSMHGADSRISGGRSRPPCAILREAGWPMAFAVGESNEKRIQAWKGSNVVEW